MNANFDCSLLWCDKHFVLASLRVPLSVVDGLLIIETNNIVFDYSTIEGIDKIKPKKFAKVSTLRCVANSDDKENELIDYDKL